MNFLNPLKPKAAVPEMQPASDGPLVWIDCEVRLPPIWQHHLPSPFRHHEVALPNTFADDGVGSGQGGNH